MDRKKTDALFELLRKTLEDRLGVESNPSPDEIVRFTEFDFSIGVGVKQVGQTDNGEFLGNKKKDWNAYFNIMSTKSEDAKGIVDDIFDKVKTNILDIEQRNSTYAGNRRVVSVPIISPFVLEPELLQKPYWPLIYDDITTITSALYEKLHKTNPSIEWSRPFEFDTNLDNSQPKGYQVVKGTDIIDGKARSIIYLIPPESHIDRTPSIYVDGQKLIFSFHRKFGVAEENISVHYSEDSNNYGAIVLDANGPQLVVHPMTVEKLDDDWGYGYVTGGHIVNPRSNLSLDEISEILGKEVPMDGEKPELKPNYQAFVDSYLRLGDKILDSPLFVNSK
jgi:hypothetical protein